jgi:adenine-specific DNA-methyltransferase
MENRLLFGDCRDHLPKLAGESVDLVVTDPPYNTGLTAGSSRLRHFFDDALSASDYRELARTVSAELFRILKNDRAAYVFINWKSLGVWLDALAGSGFRLKNCVVWDKVLHGLNYQNYAYSHEFLIFAVKGRFHPRNRGRADDSFKDLWRISRAGRQESADTPHHETVKPHEVVRRPIEHASEPGDLVLDPFAGSGTTCVVAKALDRRYLGIERDPSYYRLCLRRLTDLQAVEVSA